MDKSLDGDLNTLREELYQKAEKWAASRTATDAQLLGFAAIAYGQELCALYGHKCNVRSNPSPGAPVDGEAGDLWDADSEREDFDAWIKATPCKAQWTRRHIAWLAWLERAGRAARLSPAPKQGREWELKGFAYLQGGTMSGVNCGPALKIGETVRVREVDGGATGGEAGNGGDHANQV